MRLTLKVSVASAVAVVLTSFVAKGYAEKIKKHDVPSAVISSFEKAYPNAKMVSYSKENEDGQIEYEIKIGEGKNRLEASYNADGSLLQTEERISPDALPKEVSQALQNKFASEKIKSTEKIVKGTEVQYEVKMMKEKKNRHEVLFDQNGQILSDKEMKKKESRKKVKDIK